MSEGQNPMKQVKMVMEKRKNAALNDKIKIPSDGFNVFMLNAV